MQPKGCDVGLRVHRNHRQLIDVLMDFLDSVGFGFSGNFAFIRVIFNQQVVNSIYSLLPADIHKLDGWRWRVDELINSLLTINLIGLVVADSVRDGIVHYLSDYVGKRYANISLEMDWAKWKAGNLIDLANRQEVFYSIFNQPDSQRILLNLAGGESFLVRQIDCFRRDIKYRRHLMLSLCQAFKHAAYQDAASIAALAEARKRMRKAYQEEPYVSDLFNMAFNPSGHNATYTELFRRSLQEVKNYRFKTEGDGNRSLVNSTLGVEIASFMKMTLREQVSYADKNLLLNNLHQKFQQQRRSQARDKRGGNRSIHEELDDTCHNSKHFRFVYQQSTFLAPHDIEWIDGVIGPHTMKDRETALVMFQGKCEKLRQVISKKACQLVILILEHGIEDIRLRETLSPEEYLAKRIKFTEEEMACKLGVKPKYVKTIKRQLKQNREVIQQILYADSI